jgi:hypothetical protein
MGTSLAAKVGVAFGAFYVALGVLGFFVTGFEGFTQNGPDKLLGVSVNPFHNLVHLGTGAFLLIMSLQKNDAAAEGGIMGVGLFYVTAFVIGVTATNNLTILSMYGEGELANYFHLLSGVTLLGAGLISSGATAAAAKRRGLA